MSRLNILGVVNNMIGRTNIYTPLIEIVVNAIQAIELKREAGVAVEGAIEITVIRAKQAEMDIGQTKPAIDGFRVKDNGIGFNETHQKSFDELFTDRKVKMGCKGFGRFTALKYFQDLRVESVYRQGEGYERCSFFMGKKNNLIEKKNCSPVSEAEPCETGSIVSLLCIKSIRFPGRSLDDVGSQLVEKLLPYFVETQAPCPVITLCEEDGSDALVLNNYLMPDSGSKIVPLPIAQSDFVLHDDEGRVSEPFSVKVFKVYAPKSRRSSISLVGHRREVTNTMAHQFIPEFKEGFEDDEGSYLLKVYVFGEYLDKNVSLTRGDFDFVVEAKDTKDLVHPFSQREIEELGAKVLGGSIPDIEQRAQMKKEQVQRYINERAPWHKRLFNGVDLCGLSFNPGDAEIEEYLQQAKFQEESKIRHDVNKVLSEGSEAAVKAQASSLVQRISESSQNDLVHYIAQRRCVLDLMGKSLDWDDDQTYSTEADVHNIIFPMRENSDSISFEDHNLWILDERLNFTSFVTSDKPFTEGKAERPDLLAYNNPVIFRGDNEPSNPVTIFEFKRPGRTDFIRPSKDDDDPIKQVIRYAKKLRSGNLTTPKGRHIQVTEQTPLYAFIVCSIDKPEVRDWLEVDYGYTAMPDNQGYYNYQQGRMNMYIEVLSWEKVLKDARMRNAIFFEKLGING